jgi:hypothetical protein
MSNTTNHFDILSLKLLSYASGNEQDITKMWDEIEIFEDMYTNCLSGQVTIIDSMNLIYHFSLCGREKLEISFKTPFFEGLYGSTAVTRTFRVYKISEREPRANDKSLRYTLHFVSEEFVKSQQTKISKAYEGRVDEVIKNIYTDYLKIDYTGNSKKSLDLSKTMFRHKFIIPYWSPLSAINWLTARAVDADNKENCNFIFYEDLEGFKMKSFAELAKQQPIGEYEYFPQAREEKDGVPSGRDLIKEYRTVREFLMMEYHNTMKNIENGFYASRLLFHDIVRKQWGCIDYAYNQEFFKADHIEKNPLVAAGNDNLSPHPLSYFKYYPKHKWMYGNENQYADNDKYQEWVLKRNAQMQQIEGARLQFTLPGNSKIRIGQVIKLTVPSFEEKLNPFVDWMDKYMSGKYIISAIRHHLTLGTGYKMRLELTRDSLPTALPDSKVWYKGAFPEQGDFFSSSVKV